MPFKGDTVFEGNAAFAQRKRAVKKAVCQLDELMVFRDPIEMEKKFKRQKGDGC